MSNNNNEFNIEGLERAEEKEKTVEETTPTEIAPEPNTTPTPTTTEKTYTSPSNNQPRKYHSVSPIKDYMGERSIERLSRVVSQKEGETTEKNGIRLERGIPLMRVGFTTNPNNLAKSIAYNSEKYTEMYIDAIQPSAVGVSIKGIIEARKILASMGSKTINADFGEEPMAIREDIFVGVRFKISVV